VILCLALSEGLSNDDLLYGIFRKFFEILLSSYWQIIAIFILFKNGVANGVLPQLLGYAFLVLYLKITRMFLRFISILGLSSRGKRDVALALTVG
jgi:hypothetical protein